MKKTILLSFFLLQLTFNSFGQDGAEGIKFIKPELVRPFKINIPQKRIDQILSKVKGAKLPAQMPAADGSTSNWETGMDIKWLSELQDYWVKHYNWREQEKTLNKYPQFIAKVDDYDIQFYYVKGEGKNPLPMVLTHGWPGSTFEFFDVIDPLTNPTKYGGKAEDAFTLIIPALPGFGFSSMPKTPVNSATTAKIWNKLMTEIIGIPHYVAQGGDWGAGATVQLAAQFPKNVKAIDVNFFPGQYVPLNEQTDAEKKYFADIEKFKVGGWDYWNLQADKPMMAAVALHDSPLGTAGWIAEKFWAWADYDTKLEDVISKDRLLNDIMLYLVNDGGIDGSFWYYRGALVEYKNFKPMGFVTVPTSISQFPKDLPLSHPPIETAKRGYNVVRFTNQKRGGHFAAMEQPEIFVKEIREAFKAYR